MWQAIQLLVLFSNLCWPVGMALEAAFSAPLRNVTAKLGDDAIFTCRVENLGGFRVAWIKVDTKAILAIHTHTVTHNTRISVSRGDEGDGRRTWHLKISNVTLSDSGLYMCQINTDPMKHETASLSVVQPPRIYDGGGGGAASSDEGSPNLVLVPEGGNVVLRCNAAGIPRPKVTWKRRDGRPIHLRTGSGSAVTKVGSYTGETMALRTVTRSDMGRYDCIASNGVSPDATAATQLLVNFPPLIHAPDAAVGSRIGGRAVLHCMVEASPKSVNYWTTSRSDKVIVADDRMRPWEQSRDPNEVQTDFYLEFYDVRKEDFGEYRCASRNSFGEIHSTITLYELEENAVDSSERRDPLSADWGATGRHQSPIGIVRQRADQDVDDDDAEKVEIDILVKPSSASSSPTCGRLPYYIFILAVAAFWEVVVSDFSCFLTAY